MLAKLILALTLIPLGELYLLLLIGQHIGAGWTLGIVVVTGVLGSIMLKRQGTAAMRKIREALAVGRMPTTELVDGVLIAVAGALLITPGVLTDAAGFTLLVPQGRAVVRRYLNRRWQRWLLDHSTPIQD